MKFSKFRGLVVLGYERLFARRFMLENERDFDLYPAEAPPPRRSFRITGAIFPTESILSRYQY